MCTLSFAIYFGLKWLTWWRERSEITHTSLRSVAYLLAWPGMDATAFLGSAHVRKPGPSLWCWALAKTCIGILLMWVCARHVPASLPLLRGWVGLLALILLLHFGTFELVALAWQAAGVNAQAIMQKPLSSQSLSEFWGKRWNLGFRQLSHEFVFPAIAQNYRHASRDASGFSDFRIDPRIRHFTARARRLRPPHRLLRASGSRRSPRTFANRPPFRFAKWNFRLGLHGSAYRRTRLLAFSSTFCNSSGATIDARNPRHMTQSSLHQFFGLALWLAGAGHFVILFASFQVPHRLNWRN